MVSELEAPHEAPHDGVSRGLDGVSAVSERAQDRVDESGDSSGGRPEGMAARFGESRILAMARGTAPTEKTSSTARELEVT